jgi:hypothetical protein
VPICQDCWQDRNPNDYVPELTGWGTCHNCGNDSLTLSAHPADWPDRPEGASPLENPMRSNVTMTLDIEHTVALGVDVTALAKFAAQGIQTNIGQPISKVIVTPRYGVSGAISVPAPDPVAAVWSTATTKSGPTAFEVAVDNERFVLVNWLSAQGYEVRRRGIGSQPTLGFISRSSAYSGEFAVSPTVGSRQRFLRGDEAVRYLVSAAKRIEDLGNTFVVNVQKLDVARGLTAKQKNAERTKTCAFAQALQRQTGKEWYVSSNYAYPVDNQALVYDLPKSATAAIEQFDRDGSTLEDVDTGEFVLTLQSGAVKNGTPDDEDF